MCSTSTRTDLTDHSINAHPRAALPHAPAQPSGRYDETDSAASSTNTCRSHKVTGFSAPTGSLVFRRFCGSCPSGGPGCEDGLGFLRGGLLRAWAAKSGGDDDPAELDGHVVVGRFGLRGVPAGPSPVPDDVTGAVT